MNDLHLRTCAHLAGLCFATWPLFMNRSGLKGSVTALAFAAIAALTIASVIVFRGVDPSAATANWWLVAAAGACGGLAMMSMNAMVTGATAGQLGGLFLLSVTTQIVVAAVYHVIATRAITGWQVACFLGALFTVYALTRR